MNQTVDRAKITAHLERVKASPLFEARQQLSDLLDFLVTEELEGRGDKIKGYVIAVDVFDRGTDFDASTDSSVRVAMGRLREALEIYYARDDADRSVRINIPKGVYRPTFHFGPEENVEGDEGAEKVWGQSLVDRVLAFVSQRNWSRPAALFIVVLLLGVAFLGKWSSQEPSANGYLGFTLRDTEGPRIAVFPLRALASDENLDVLAYGLSVDTVTEISRFRWLTVFFSSDSSKRVSETVPVKNWDYELRGETQMDNIDLRVNVRLTNSQTGQVLWANAYTELISASTMIQIQKSIAEQIALTVAKRDGVIARLEERRIVRDTTKSTTAYACVLRAYNYWRSFLQKEHIKVRACLERAMPKQPLYAEAHAALAFMYLDESRYGINKRPGYDPMERALDHASQAFKLNPLSTLAAQSLFTVRGQIGDAEKFRQIGQKALRNSPNNPELLADFGNKLALNIGEWKAGTELTQRAIKINPDAPGWYFIALAFNAYRNGNYAESIEWSDKMNIPDFFLYQIVRLAAFYRLGNQNGVKFHIQELSRLGYDSLDETLRYLADSRLSGDVMDKLRLDVTKAFGYHS